METPRERDLAIQASTLFDEQSAIIRRSSNPLVKAALGTAPFTGGVASLLSDLVQKRQEIRLRKFLVTLAEEVESQKSILLQKVDKKFVGSDEFAAAVEGVLEEAARNADDRKLEFLRKFLLASSLVQRPDISWRDIFMQYLRQLSGAHLVVLALFSELQGSLPESDRMSGIEIEGKVPIGLSQVCASIPSIDSVLGKVVCIDLANLGLIFDWRLIAPSQKAFQEHYSLSQSGVLFMRFLEGHWK